MDERNVRRQVLKGNGVLLMREGARVVIYPDTSVFFSLHVREESSEAAERFMRRVPEPMVFTPLHRLELRTALRCRVYRGTLSPNHLKQALQSIELSLERGIFRHETLPWTAALREAERIGEAHVAETGVRSTDLLHVACAVVLNAGLFVTFDHRQSILAARAGLKIKNWR